jgi:hypothetical protein
MVFVTREAAADSMGRLGAQPIALSRLRAFVIV